MKYRRWFWMIVLLLAAPALLEAAQDRTIKRKGNTETRYALVIGNGAYPVGPLKNPVNDARDMAALLGEMGFDVIYRADAGHREMEEAVMAFGRKLKGGGIGLFYYAGHGMQVKGRNYLIPVDARIETETDVKFASLDAGQVLGKMEDAGNRLNIVILDACRVNPFARSFRSPDKGLARMDAPRGSLIAYATSPGSVAADGGVGRNGVFTGHLKKHMRTPGLKIEDVLKKVRVDVIDATDGKQVPWESSSLTGDFYFADSSGTVVVEPVAGPGRLEVTVAPNVRDAAVWINGVNHRRARLFSIPKRSRYQVRVTADGYDAYETDVEVGPGEKKTVTAYLEKEVVEPEPVVVAPTPVEPRQKDRFTNSLGMEFVRIPAGSFLMGSPSGEPGRDDDEKQHRVTLTRDFYMQTTEVTQAQWQAVMGSNPSDFKDCGDDCPVENVSWNNVQEFIQKLNRRDGENYRLPTEAEWEYAARAGTKTALYSGPIEIKGKNNAPALDPIAWYGGNSCVSYANGSDCSGWPEKQKTCSTCGPNPVGRKAPNDWGLYDMIGNVWEWCADWYGDYPAGAVKDPGGPDRGESRVLRGGSWDSYAGGCRSAHRYNDRPGDRNNYIGFRLTRSYP